MIRAVLDTNILLSGLIVSLGYPAAIIDAFKKSDFIFLTSEILLWELKKIVQYPRIYKRYRLSEKKIEEYFKILRLYGIIVYPKDALEVLVNQPIDNMVLATAVKGKADYIVSGDRHLLKLKKYKGIKILPPAEFCRVLKGS